MNKFNEIQRIELTELQKKFVGWTDQMPSDSRAHHLEVCFKIALFECETYCYGSSEQVGAKILFEIITHLRTIESADDSAIVKDIFLTLFEKFTSSIETYRLLKSIFLNGIFHQQTLMTKEQRFSFYVFSELLDFTEKMYFENMDMAKVKTKAA
jgi:hypothetical protein